MLIQWEHQAFKISGGSLIEGLNKLGADGWQAVHIDHHSDHELVIVRRPKPIMMADPFVFPGQVRKE